VHRRANVQVDDPQLVAQLRAAGEGATAGDAGVQRDRTDREARSGHPPMQLVDALVGGEIDLHRLDVRAKLFELACGTAQLGSSAATIRS